jgi:methyl-accepting chemotaxis protein
VRAIRGVEVEYRGEPVYEIAKRFGGPNGGFAHLGLWRAAADEETRRAVIPIVLTTVALLAGTLAVSALIVRRLIRPFLRLVEDAGRISKGDWVVPLELKRADEIGDIARSLARLDPRQQSTESGL